MVSPDPVDDQLRRPAHPDRIPSGEAGHHLPTLDSEQIKGVKADVTDGYGRSQSAPIPHPLALVIQPPGKEGARRLGHRLHTLDVESDLRAVDGVAVLRRHPLPQRWQCVPRSPPYGHHLHRQTDQHVGSLPSFTQQSEYDIVEQGTELRPIAEP
jgi:hypothetical protein